MYGNKQQQELLLSLHTYLLISKGNLVVITRKTDTTLHMYIYTTTIIQDVHSQTKKMIPS